jgi:hypothetical protein
MSKGKGKGKAKSTAEPEDVSMEEDDDDEADESVSVFDPHTRVLGTRRVPYRAFILNVNRLSWVDGRDRSCRYNPQLGRSSAP